MRSLLTSTIASLGMKVEREKQTWDSELNISEAALCCSERKCKNTLKLRGYILCQTVYFLQSTSDSK